MKNNNRVKYVALLVLFTLLFFVSMCVCIVGYRTVANQYKYESLKGRIELAEFDESFYGPDHIYSTMSMYNCYEPEFDKYWEFVDVQRIYLRGRFGDDPDGAIEQINDYISTCSDKRRIGVAEEYIDKIKKQQEY